MNILLQLLLIFLLGLVLVLIAQFALKEYRKWKLAVTLIGSLFMSFPFLFVIYMLLLILQGSR